MFCGISATLARGSSSDRQRAKYAEQGRIADVMKLVVDETTNSDGSASGRPAPAVAGYVGVAGDEALSVDGVPSTPRKGNADHFSPIAA